MTLVAIVHASANRRLGLLIAILIYAAVTEQASIRLGRTHCHRTDTGYMVSQCSSLNSVVYYVPWLYSCFVAGRRLCGNTWGAVWLIGAMHFGFCGPYEMQGPSFDWWKCAASACTPLYVAHLAATAALGTALDSAAPSGASLT